MHLTDWRATRAGATITVNGKNETGAEVKLTGVTVIQPGRVVTAGDAYAVATDKDGMEHHLAI